MRTYSELIRLPTFSERFRYLKLKKTRGTTVFGNERYLNQLLYRSHQWRQARNFVITRDMACDLGVEGFEIPGKVTIHHMNPVTIEQLQQEAPELIDPEYLISVSTKTHEAIHLGLDEYQLCGGYIIERKAGDTKLW